MDIREELDTCPCSARLQQLQLKNAEEVLAVCSQLCTAFTSNQLAEAQALTAQLQYLHRIESTIKTHL